MTPAKGCAARTPQAGGKSEIGPVGTTPPLVWAQHYRSNPSTGPSLVRFSPEMRLMHGAKTFDTPSIFRKRAAGGPLRPRTLVQLPHRHLPLMNTCATVCSIVAQTELARAIGAMDFIRRSPQQAPCTGPGA